jgi:hypothetical protein
MTPPFKQPGDQSGEQTGNGSPAQSSASNSPASQPPERKIGETTLNSLPVLTEIVAVTDAHQAHELDTEEIQKLLLKLEARIETLFTQRLGIRLEQIQRQAVDQALDELKAELPELVRDALNKHLESS